MLDDTTGRIETSRIPTTKTIPITMTKANEITKATAKTMVIAKRKRRVGAFYPCLPWAQCAHKSQSAH